MSASHRREWIADLLIVVAIVGLPVAGAKLSGRALRPLLQFPPPLVIPTYYPRFSWIAGALVLLAVGALIAPWIWRRHPARAANEGVGHPTTAARFPWWGYAGCVWTAGWWLLAWTRYDWFAPLQSYTFFPLWLGFIVSVNALTCARAGTCRLRHAPGTVVALFVASAGFWWMFEWLNRFVANWHYLGAERFGPAGYAVHATLCFSTVLPAVTAARDFLRTFHAWDAALERGPRWTLLSQPAAGSALLLAGAAALVLTGARPQQFYPALWAAPLALGLGADACRRGGLAAEVASGNWRQAVPWMLAALGCGFCWELWNWHSDPKWIYTVPYVDRWHIFEMPLLGYTGYLPFGLECGYVAARLLGGERRAPFSRVSST